MSPMENYLNLYDLCYTFLAINSMTIVLVRLRQILASNADLARKLEQLEKKYDKQFKVVFDAIRELMTSPEPKKRPIGFLADR